MANTVHARGEFQLNTDYHVLDIVSNGDRDYLCVRANEGEDVTDQEYWMLLAQGPQGPKGDPGSIATTNLSTADLNDLKSNGYYYTNGQTLTHSPAPNSAYANIIVVASPTGTNGTQFLHDTDNNELYIRSWRSDGTWTAWRQTTLWT
ncbi:pyocin knob domain-containing protein [Limosilactobacillus mucosae]|uniref:pyocin knob domain-containing protein n=1 Tax=Limosilactobacillus mucosae TaxID=97478 RepID=UPI00233F5AA9|nr:pyocin knob domain-containing protein [Limosilactobacillus mucosae]MDC2839631.1 pyocin knob domain-containing protein [Limosilactobacillus mucosae]